MFRRIPSGKSLSWKDLPNIVDSKFPSAVSMKMKSIEPI